MLLVLPPSYPVSSSTYHSFVIICFICALKKLYWVLVSLKFYQRQGHICFAYHGISSPSRAPAYSRVQIIIIQLEPRKVDVVRTKKKCLAYVSWDNSLLDKNSLKWRCQSIFNKACQVRYDQRQMFSFVFVLYADPKKVTKRQLSVVGATLHFKYEIYNSN